MEHVRRIVAAQADLIDRAGGIELAAEKCGYSKSQVGRWHNREGNDLMALAAVIKLEMLTNSHFVTAALVSMHGAEMVPAKRDGVSLIACHIEGTRAEARYNEVFAEAIADNVITGTEQRELDLAHSARISASENARSILAGYEGRAVKVI